jgi:hypothetical protein
MTVDDQSVKVDSLKREKDSFFNFHFSNIKKKPLIKQAN